MPDIIGNEDVYYFQNHAVAGSLRGDLSKPPHTYEAQN